MLKTLKREAIDVKFGFVTSEQSQEMRDDADAERTLDWKAIYCRKLQPRTHGGIWQGRCRWNFYSA